MMAAFLKGLTEGGWSGFIRQFLRREASPPVQFVKYVISGGIAVASHTLVFFLAACFVLPALDQKDIIVRLLGLTVSDMAPALRARNAMINNVPAFLVSNTVAYLINIFWVFQPGRYPWYLEAAMFFAVSALAMFLGTSIMGLLIRYLDWSTIIAFSANLFTALLINFTLRKFVIFKG